MRNEIMWYAPFYDVHVCVCVCVLVCMCMCMCMCMIYLSRHIDLHTELVRLQQGKAQTPDGGQRGQIDGGIAT